MRLHLFQTKELSVTLKKDKLSHQQNNHQPPEMELADASTLRIAPPSTIPGLKPSHKYNVLGPSEKSQSQQSTPTSDENNSPTELNCYKKMTEKPPLIKRIALGLTGSLHDSTDDDSCPLVSENNSAPGSPTNRPLSGGYVNETNNDSLKNQTVDSNVIKTDIVESINLNLTKKIDTEHNRLLLNAAEDFIKSNRISQISSSSCPQTGTESTFLGFTPTPPPLPERTDSLNNKDEGELRTAPWFQAGIPREIALEILAREPIGAFMVRESTSKPGCFALSLRVPRSFQPTGIAHYLIVKTNKGYKIKVNLTKTILLLIAKSQSLGFRALRKNS